MKQPQKQNRIEAIFASLRCRQRSALMPFITAGYPSLEVTRRVIPALEQAGASIIEIGFPFSDPIADGPVIAASMHEALRGGVTPRTIFETIKAARPSTKAGLIAMVSHSIVARIGPEPFVRASHEAGFDGLIIPDIDLDAARPMAGLARLHNLTLSLLIAPTTSNDRARTIASLSTGFLYMLARVGLTGESADLDLARLRERVSALRKHSELPIAVGFGISKPEQVSAVASFADAAIIGSALVRQMGAADDPVEAAGQLVERMSEPLQLSGSPQ